MEILSPIGNVASRVKMAAGDVSGVRAKTVAFVNNGWPAMGPIVDQMARRLQQEYGVETVIQEGAPISSAAPAELLDRVAGRADLAIVGLAT